ncbi:MAG: hypothetical protein N4A53_10390 [Pelagimonas sp.]|jgi:hypothetical protein|nr:hypothetical protein [Pelagimonas sp.]
MIHVDNDVEKAVVMARHVFEEKPAFLQAGGKLIACSIAQKIPQPCERENTAPVEETTYLQDISRLPTAKIHQRFADFYIIYS